MAAARPELIVTPGTRVLGRYVVESAIGEGGTATVWRGVDERDGSIVAIKIPTPSFLEDGEERFRRELARNAQLRHPRIVAMRATGEEQGVPLAILEFMPGGTLSAWIAAHSHGTPARLPAPALCSWLPGVAEVLDHLHGVGIVHRDLKPANVLFDAAGEARVTDFGFSKAPGREKSLTPTGAFVGTPDYLAPEQFLDSEVDGRADQYALATIVFEATAGFPPFPRGSLGRLALMKTTEAAPSLARVAPDLPPPLCAAVGRALALEPGARFSSCGAFVRATR